MRTSGRVGTGLLGWAVTAAVTMAMATSAWSQYRPWPTSPRVVQPPRSHSADWVADLREWVDAAYAHTPGSTDEQAFIIGAWSADELHYVLDNLKALRARLPKAMARATRSASRAPTVEYNKRALDLLNVQQLLRLTDDEARRGDVTRLVTRAAMLHADIAMRLESRGTTGTVSWLRTAATRGCRREASTGASVGCCSTSSSPRRRATRRRSSGLGPLPHTC